MLFLRLFAFCFCAIGLFGQDYRAKVQGFVTDSSDAPVAGAKVTLLNVGTGIAVSRDSGENGAYLFDNVEPGTYTISAELQGFSRQVQEGVLVQTRQDVSVNFSLKPGTVVETVTVEAQAVSLQFNTTTRELTVDRKMLMDLPVKARNPFTLALLDPAVVNRYTSDRNPFFMWSSSSIDVGGDTTRKNDLLLDGAPIQVGPKGSYSPPMDATQEFSVQQNSIDAEFGHTAGGILSLSTRSGTNEYHGTAYYFGRNPALNAMQNPINRSPNTSRNHIWGGTVGGPIKRNKLFTFFAYEGWRVNEPRDTIRTMPTDLERTGNFSQSLNRSGGLRTIYDPTTTVLDVANNTATRQPFANNIIPANRIDPTAARIMQDIWGPNNPGNTLAGTNNFRTSYPWLLKNWNVTNRTDWNISDNLKVFGRYSQFKTTIDQGNYTPNNSRAMPNDNGGIMNSRGIAGDLVYTSSPRTVFNFRGSFSSLEDDYSAPDYAVGAEGLANFWPNNPWYQPYLAGIPAIYYPQISMNYGTTACGTNNPCTTFGKSNYWIQHPRHYAFSGKVSHVHGSHYLKVGAEYRHHVGEGVYPRLMEFTSYADMTTANPIQPNVAVSGDPYATFLLGTIDNRAGNQAGARPYLASHIPFVGIFVHDDWKISRRVTLNLGLRYEWESGPYDEQDQYSRELQLNAPNEAIQRNPPNIPADLLALSTPKWNGQWVFTDSGNRSAWVTQNNIFLPRAGVAVRVNDKTALNVGWGRYVVPISTIGRTLEECTGWCSGFSQNSVPLQQTEFRPQAYLSNPFPASTNPLQPVTGKGLGVYTNVGNPLNFPNQNYKAQVNDRVNFTIMRELPGQFKVDATWFMHIGRYGPITGDELLNMADPNLSYTYKADLARNIPNPFFNYQTRETFPGALRNQATVSRLSLLSPYPHYGQITQHNVGRSRQRYQALQLRVQRTYAAGAMVLLAYNYNQERTEQYFNDPDRYARRFFWMPSLNARHRLTLAGSYELPFGKGKKFGSDMHPVLNAAFGGWQFSGIYTYRSGEFLRWFTQQDLIGDPHIENPGPSGWFNTSAFRVATPFTPRTNPWQFSDITGPIFWNADATVSKTFPIMERYRLEFRFEAYNLTNSLMWANPSTVVTDATFGRSVNQANQNRGREMQYTLRFHF